jgi:hypothetical protein
LELLIDTTNYKIEESINDIKIPSEFNFIDKKIWDENILTLKNFYEKNPNISLLSYLYWNFGRETGSFQRILINNNISWVIIL